MPATKGDEELRKARNGMKSYLLFLLSFMRWLMLNGLYCVLAARINALILFIG